MKRKDENDCCVKAYYESMALYDAYRQQGIQPQVVRLNNCKASIIYCDVYILLRSYQTIVAAYDTRDGTMYDFLRYAFGYSAASAQHIAKFRERFNPRAFLRFYP